MNGGFERAKNKIEVPDSDVSTAVREVGNVVRQGDTPADLDAARVAEELFRLELELTAAFSDLEDANADLYRTMCTIAVLGPPPDATILVASKLSAPEDAPLREVLIHTFENTLEAAEVVRLLNELQKFLSENA